MRNKRTNSDLARPSVGNYYTKVMRMPEYDEVTKQHKKAYVNTVPTHRAKVLTNGKMKLDHIGQPRMIQLSRTFKQI